MIVGSPIPEEPLMPNLVSFSWPPTTMSFSLLLFERGGRVDYNEVQKGVMVFLSGN